MVEVLVRQDNMVHRAPGEQPDVGVDRGRLGERGSGVDEQRPVTTANQPDGNVAQREPAAMHTAAQSFPGEMHTLRR
ncbi:hypothetical protein MTY59_41980 [Mycobacterium senriense]|uniref:Uncharacterized protein n=1 Tax=Mycobacterium senriense TaxID=2775496 RepID=A0ABN6IMR0_9MYCO|nr:hypothetical protein MTY59_41980 [Mycobacterium senriense]